MSSSYAVWSFIRSNYNVYRKVGVLFFQARTLLLELKQCAVDEIIMLVIAGYVCVGVSWYDALSTCCDLAQ